MGYFDGNDDEAERRLSAFEAASLSASGTVIRDYVDMVVTGQYVRLLVRQVQKRLEAGRPWPKSFAGPAELLAHLDRISFELRCPTSDRAVPEERAFSFTEYESRMLPLYRERLPRLLEANFWLNLRVGIQAGVTNAGVGSRTYSVVEGILAAQLGAGDLITALKVAMRMVEEGIDGGIRRLRHIVLTTGLRRDIDGAKRILSRLMLNCDERDEIRRHVTRAINASGLVSRPVIELDVLLFQDQYVGGLVDAVSACYFPADLG